MSQLKLIDDHHAEIPEFKLPLDLFRFVESMRDRMCPELDQFVALVRMMMRAEGSEKYGVPWSKIKADEARAAVSAILQEFKEQAKPIPPLDFTKWELDPLHTEQAVKPDGP